MNTVKLNYYNFNSYLIGKTFQSSKTLYYMRSHEKKIYILGRFSQEKVPRKITF